MKFTEETARAIGWILDDVCEIANETTNQICLEVGDLCVSLYGYIGRAQIDGEHQEPVIHEVVCGEFDEFDAQRMIGELDVLKQVNRK